MGGYGGICVDGINQFECKCNVGYVGGINTKCEIAPWLLYDKTPVCMETYGTQSYVKDAMSCQILAMNYDVPAVNGIKDTVDFFSYDATRQKCRFSSACSFKATTNSFVTYRRRTSTDSVVKPSPIDCDGYYTLGKCSTTCGIGTQWRTFTIETQPQHGGKACPTGTLDEYGGIQDVQECVNEPCPTTADPQINFIDISIKDKDFCTGFNLFKDVTDSEDICMQKCKDTPKCRYYSYFHQTQYCVLTMHCETKGKAQDGTTVTIKKLDAPLEVIFTEVQGDVFCDENKLFSGKTSGLSDCEQKCVNNAECKYASFWYSGTDNYCVLTKTCTKKTNQNHKIGIRTKLQGGPTTVPPTTVGPTTASTTSILLTDSTQTTTSMKANDNIVFTFIQNKDHEYCDAPKLFDGSTDTLEECEKKCINTLNCEYISYFHQSKHCYLTSTCDKKQTDTTFQLVTLSDWKGDCKGRALSSQKVANLNDCESECISKTQCNNFVFWSKINWCKTFSSCQIMRYHKDKSSVMYERQQGNKNIEIRRKSGSVKQTTTQVSSTFELKSSSNWIGDCKDRVLSSDEAKDFDDCKGRCRLDSQCNNFVFWKNSNNWCKTFPSCKQMKYNKDKSSVMYQRRKNNEPVTIPQSTTQITATSTKPEEWELISKSKACGNAFGNALGFVPSKAKISLKDCQDRCVKTANCRRIDYYTKSKYCAFYAQSCDKECPSQGSTTNDNICILPTISSSKGSSTYKFHGTNDVSPSQAFIDSDENSEIGTEATLGIIIILIIVVAILVAVIVAMLIIRNNQRSQQNLGYNERKIEMKKLEFCGQQDDSKSVSEQDLGLLGQKRVSLPPFPNADLNV